MSMWTGMGPDKPAPKMDPNCQCICHTQPGVMHVVSCCSPPAALAASPEVQALIRDAEARVWREAAKEARECDYPWASPTNEQADACDQMAERIADWLDSRAATAAFRAHEPGREGAE